MKKRAARRSQNSYQSWLYPLLILIGIAIAGYVLLSAATQSSPVTQQPRAQLAGNTYYVSPTGSDTNTGTATAPFKTFAKSLTVMVPGDTLLVKGGMYTERLVFNKSGQSGAHLTVKAAPGEIPVIDGQNARGNLIEVPVGRSYITVDGLEVKNSNAYGVSLSGQYINAYNLNIHNIIDMGLYIDGQHMVLRGNRVYLASYGDKGTTASSGWGSGIKCRVGGDDLVFENNLSYNNYGEGIAVTRCSNVTVRGNTFYDNFGVNLYIDNSHDVLVEKNVSYCTANAEFYRNGSPASGISIGEEDYGPEWGYRLARIKIQNNVVANCSRGIIAFDPYGTAGGLDTVTIANNTLWGSKNTALSMPAATNKTRNTRIMNNVIQQPTGKVAWIEDRTGITLSNNFWVGVTSVTAFNANGTGDKFGDVKLAGTGGSSDPLAYRLSSTSPAIDGGAAIGITDDYEGKARTAAPDMGAFEYSGSVTSTATPTPIPSLAQTIAPTATRTPTPTPTRTPTPLPSLQATPTRTPTPTPVNGSLSPTPTLPASVIPNPPYWFTQIPPNLKNFLEQLYILVFYFQRTSNLQYLLDGLPTPTP